MRRFLLLGLVLGLFLFGFAEAQAKRVKVNRLLVPATVPDLAEASEFRLAANDAQAEDSSANRGRVDSRLLRGLIGKYDESLGAAASRLDRRDRAGRAAIAQKRQVLRNFLSSDYNVDILAWQIENDKTVDLTPMPDTGKPLNDWLTWFIENIDEIVAAIQKIIGLFENLNPGVQLIIPMHDGSLVCGTKTEAGVSILLLRRAA